MNWGLVASPFILGGFIWGFLKACEQYDKWRYRRAIYKRNRKIALFGLKPFPGTKQVPYDDIY